jgi:ribonuclease HI
MYYLVIADGGKKQGIAYGSYKVFDDSGKLVAHNQHVFGANTSNQAEYLALISALGWCQREKLDDVVVFMDSLLTVNQVKGEWKCLNPGLLPLLGRAIRLKNGFNSFEINHISRRYISQKLGH